MIIYTPPHARGGKCEGEQGSVHDFVRGGICTSGFPELSAHVMFAFKTNGLLTAAPGALGGRGRNDRREHAASTAGHTNSLQHPHGGCSQSCAAAAWAGSLGVIPVDTLASEEKAL